MDWWKIDDRLVGFGMGMRFRLDRPLGNGLWVGTWSINGFGYLGKLVGCLAWFMVWVLRLMGKGDEKFEGGCERYGF